MSKDRRVRLEIRVDRDTARDLDSLGEALSMDRAELLERMVRAEVRTLDHPEIPPEVRERYTRARSRQHAESVAEIRRAPKRRGAHKNEVAPS